MKRFPQGEIFVGDLLRAFAAIDVSDPQTAATVASLLGFYFKADVAGESSARIQPESMTQRTSSAHEPEPSKPEAAPDQLPPKLTPGQGRFSELRPQQTSEADMPELITSVTGFDIARFPRQKLPQVRQTPEWPEWEQEAKTKMALQPLLWPNWARGIVGEAAATLRDTGEIDLVSAVEALASGVDLDRIPRASVRTLSRGCQVLIDASAGLLPFTKDVRHLIRTLIAVVGRERVEALRFNDCPIYGVEVEPNLDFEPYQPPARGTPVLLISDLGIAEKDFSLRRASARDWLRMSDWLEEAGCPLIALIPYPPERWPSQLNHAFPIIQWDRRTTVSDILHAKRRS